MLTPPTIQSSLPVLWHFAWHAAMYANIERQKSIKHLLRNRKDIIRIIQAFSHACISVSDRDDCLLWGSQAHVFLFVLSLTKIRRKKIFMRPKCRFPEETKASCPRLNVWGYTGVICLYRIGSVQLLKHPNIVCLYMCRHSSVPMEAWVNVCCKLSGQSTHHGRLISVCPPLMLRWCIYITCLWKIVFVT